MPSPINGFHQDETVKPEKMGRENMEDSTRPSFIRQRSNVQKVDDDDELDGRIHTVCKHQHENSDTSTKCVKFKNDEYFNKQCAHGSDTEGIELRAPENNDEECASLTNGDDKQYKRQRHQNKKYKQRWFMIAGCGVLILLIVMGALGFSLYTHFHPQQNPSDHHGILYCYSCDLVKGKDMVTYEEKRKLCCVGKNAELKIAKDKISPVTTKQVLTGKEKIQFQEMEIDFERSDTESLGLKITEAGDSPFLHLTENGKTITIDEDGLYMMTLIMTATTFKKYSDTASKYYTFMSCLKFVKNGKHVDDLCRTITILSAMRLPFEIHKSKHLEKGTVIHITATDVELLDQKSSLSKLSILQLHKSVHKVTP